MFFSYFFLKNLIFSGVFTENQYMRGNCLKSGTWTECRSKVGLVKNRGVVFLWGGGVNNLMHTMDFDFFSRNPILKSQ